MGSNRGHCGSTLITLVVAVSQRAWTGGLHETVNDGGIIKKIHAAIAIKIMHGIGALKRICKRTNVQEIPQTVIVSIAITAITKAIAVGVCLIGIANVDAVINIIVDAIAVSINITT